MENLLDCGHAASPHSEISCGYGCDEQGKTLCYDCCTARDVDQLRDTSRPFAAYISCDGRSVTNWPGRQLMRVYSHSTGRAGFGRNMHYWRALDVHGQRWHGKNSGGEGTCINLRAYK